MLMIPACPQPVTTTSPCGVFSTRDWSSGIVSSTNPAGVCTFPTLLQLCSGYLRGTGPVNHQPGKISEACSCSINLPPVASYSFCTAFFSKKDLDEYLAKLEEAKKRDHRKLGKELDLF